MVRRALIAAFFGMGLFPNGCKGSEMAWTCAGKPAIQTKIKPASVEIRYPLCFAPL